MKQLKEDILRGSLNCCLVKPSLICDPFQVVVAANKALVAEKLTTKTIYSEILFNLSISKNITQSLQKFGLDENENVILVAVVPKSEEISKEIEAFKAIDGEEVDISRLKDYTNTDAIKKAYKIGKNEISEFSLLDSVVSRIAAKEFIT